MIDMRKIAFAISLFLFSYLRLIGQDTNCNNIGFEDGTTNGWILSNGALTDNNVIAIYGTENSGTVNNEHLITHSGNDPNISAEVIPMVPTGSNYALRIGYVVQGSKYDRIKKTFTVTKDNTLLQYRFAVILQDDGTTHSSFQKPGFHARIYDNTGNDIPCSYYDIQLQKGSVLNGFKTQGQLQYRNWTTVAVDLRNYIGQTLTFEVTVHGCTKQKHFGYAYVDASCLKSEITQESSCPDANGFLTFKAPEGFESYLWSNGATTRIVKMAANIGDQISVKLVPINSLNSNCDIQLDYTVKKVPLEATIYKSICEEEFYDFYGTQYKTTGVYSKTFVRSASCDYIEYLNLTVNPLLRRTINQTLCEGNNYLLGGTNYATTGIYSLRKTNTNACDSIVTLNLNITPLDRYSFSKIICEGKTITVGDMQYDKTGIYTTTIKRVNKCDSIVTSNLTVVPKFNIDLQYDPSLMEKGDTRQILATITPNNTYSILWTHPESLSCSNCLNPWTTATSSTTYVLTVTPPEGTCSQTAYANILVGCGVWLPTAFTPNNDAINDTFYIYATRCIKEIKDFMIYNRWGQLIFRDSNFQGADAQHGWNGMIEGKLALPDTYTYKIIAETKTGEFTSYLGAITLAY